MRPGSCRRAPQVLNQSVAGIGMLLLATVLLSAMPCWATVVPFGETNAPLIHLRAIFEDAGVLRAFLAGHSDTRLLSERLILRPELLVSAAARNDLDAMRIPYEVLVEGVDVPLHEARTGVTSPASDGAVHRQPGPSASLLQRFSTFSRAGLIRHLEARADSFASITHLTVLGQSHEGNDIHAIKVSDRAGIDEDEPTILFVGVHHAQESIGVDCLIKLLDTLLDGYGLDPALTGYVDDHEIWIVPMLNPDGWLRIESGELMYWRKNTRDNNRNRQFDEFGDGVDLNRNYGYHWRLAGSADPESSGYYGPSAFSEPEVQALRDLALASRPALVLTYHMSGQLVIHHWTWNDRPVPDAEICRRIGTELAQSIPRRDGGGTYTPVEGVGMGGYLDDWIYGVVGGLSFTLEVSSLTSRVDIDAVASNHLGGALYALERLGGPQLTGHVTDVSTGAPLSARVDLAGYSTAQILPRRTEPSTGRHRRLLDPGTYTLRISADGYEPSEIENVVVAGGAPTVVDVALTPRLPLTLAPLTSHPVHSLPTRVQFYLPRTALVRLDLYSPAGRLVRTLVDGSLSAGWNEVPWNGRTGAGVPAPSGVYFVRLRDAERSVTARLILVR